MSLNIVILAAGKGTRMKSDLPKVLQPLAGKPLLSHVVTLAKSLNPSSTLVVYGHGGDHVQASMADVALEWVEQAKQQGTGQAVQCALPKLPAQGKTLILYGDVPLTQSSSLDTLITAASETGFALMTVSLEHPAGYGRIVREKGKVVRIVEHKDASAEERAIDEVNTGILCVDNALLHTYLPRLTNHNAQGEYYLTDLVAMAYADGIAIATRQPAAVWEVEGVNDKLQLANLERVWQAEQARRLMLGGLTLLDPARFDLRGSLQHGTDCSIDINVVIEGKVILGKGVRIGAGCHLRDVHIGDHSEIRPMSILESAQVAEDCVVGPYARLRPGAQLADKVHIGNFVEIKNTCLGLGSKANHLSYIGDATVGSHVNLGAGTITCNYDGINKFQTLIGDGAFIGSNNSLVAPVSIGKAATTGAGSVITKDVPDDQLAIARTRQQTVPGWKRPKRQD
ncbi:MAG: bifunctional UDP-N-acetylglucosamine diphosphorylase/glucosamine-1-phosphate N-acetyltransferase GlmU [Pseudomonadales bacterium]|nr:bifunctional UDP-N-acetylglucosamine diphosphorylase/glucosamine-1-phosphate N-acetyltransferase GlmU [Pseudomonadales bacterium]